MTLRSFGTHNLHDNAGVPTFFADVVLFTEAIPANVQAKRDARGARLRARLSGYTIRVCKPQRDLVVALRRRHYKVTGTAYRLAHVGVATVTPHRGTFVVETIERVGRLRRPRGRRVVFILEHRINAAFPPYIRGEGGLRSARWWDHTAMTLTIINRYLADGWEVRAGGDVNTPPGVVGYRALPGEFGRGFDRLASSSPVRNGEYLSRKRSDHPRLRAWS